MSYGPHKSEVLISSTFQSAVFLKEGLFVFAEFIPVMDRDFSDLNTRKNILAMMADLESQQDAIEGIENWLQEYQIWLANNKGLNL